MQRERGSALVIAVLLVSAIGTIAFSFGKVFLAGLSNMTVSSDGIYAYYSAESGMEEAFLRYRYDMNAEVPFSAWTLNDTDNKVFRSDLSDNDAFSSGSLTGAGINKTIVITDFAKQLYDLRMGYIGTDGVPFWGDDPLNAVLKNKRLSSTGVIDNKYGDSSIVLTISKDDAVKIDLTSLDLSLSDNDLILYAKMSDLAATAEKAMIEAKLTVYAGTQTNEYKTIISSDRTNSCTFLGRSDNVACQKEIIPAVQINANPLVLKVTNLLSAWRSAGLPTLINGSKVTLFLKPLYYDAKLGIITSGCQLVGNPCFSKTKSEIIPGPETYITATGYYGGISRTLTADIDRQSGTLYDLFDYVIYDFD